MVRVKKTWMISKKMRKKPPQRKKWSWFRPFERGGGLKEPPSPHLVLLRLSKEEGSIKEKFERNRGVASILNDKYISFLEWSSFMVCFPSSTT